MRGNIIALLGLLLAVGHLIAADDDKGLKKLDGVYVMVSGQESGKELPEKLVKNSTLTLEGNKYTVSLGKNKFSGTQKVDPTKTPKEIDATDTDGPNKGKTMLGIYKLEKGVFTVYFAPPGKDRPKEFTDKTKPGEIMHVWKKK